MGTETIPSVATLFAEREARLRHEKMVAEQLVRKHREELEEYRKRLDSFELTETFANGLISRIRSAFQDGENELLVTSFPCSICTDDGRAIGNIGEPPINPPSGADQDRHEEPDWLATLPNAARLIFRWWKDNLRNGGFAFSARIINYPGGMPGDVGLFISWPREAVEAPGNPKA